MKVTRSYWLGLGSGLILSAMLTMVISPYLKQPVTQRESSSVPIVNQEATTQPLVEDTKQAITQPLVEDTKQADPPLPTQPSQITAQIEQSFSIPSGAILDEIADLLLDQGFIEDKGSFLATAYQMGVENKFRTGTFTLLRGLTSKELIGRLLLN